MVRPEFIDVWGRTFVYVGLVLLILPDVPVWAWAPFVVVGMQQQVRARPLRR